MTTVLKIKIARMFPLFIINEDFPYTITLACDQRRAIISTGAVANLNAIISQDSQARHEWYLPRDNSDSHLPVTNRTCFYV